MERLERFYKIDRLLKERKSVSFEALQDALEVSPATLKRDLEYMRERFNAPIEYDREANGYRFPNIHSIPDEGEMAQGLNANANDADADTLCGDVDNWTAGCIAAQADTDGDQMTDGWEFYAAKDLNVKAVPYPGERPFPNALDPSLRSVDRHRLNGRELARLLYEINRWAQASGVSSKRERA